jgi:hypothetical protein
MVFLSGEGVMPIDRGSVDEQLQALGESWRWDQRELRDLPAVLQAEERILAISRGKIARLRWLRRSWLIVVTDARLLCVRSADGAGWRQLEVGARQIMKVGLRVGLFRGRVLVVAGAKKYRLLVPRDDAYRLSAALSSMCVPDRSKITGFGPTRMARRVVDHVLALPAAAFGPESLGPVAPVAAADSATDRRVQQLEEQVQQLEEHVQQLQQQIDFMEDLLRQRQPSAIAARGE